MTKLQKIILDVIIVITGIIIVALASYYTVRKLDKRRGDVLSSESDRVLREAEVYYKIKIDSLHGVIKTLKAAYAQDSVQHSAKVSQFNKSIYKLQSNIHEVDYKTYTDHDLDSVVRVLFPSAELSTPDFDRTFGN